MATPIHHDRHDPDATGDLEADRTDITDHLVAAADQDGYDGGYVLHSDLPCPDFHSHDPWELVKKWKELNET